METKYAVRYPNGDASYLVNYPGGSSSCGMDAKRAYLFDTPAAAGRATEAMLVHSVRDQQALEIVAVDITTTEGGLEEVPLPEGHEVARSYASGVFTRMSDEGMIGKLCLVKRSSPTTTHTVRELR